MPLTLDPTVVNLAKAIRQTESGGNFSASGKSGEQGGYQFTPNTWNATASKYGINVPLDQATPQQQNAVAYNRIKAWKDAGYNVTQIASMWNAGEGEPNAYTGKFSTGKPSSTTTPGGTPNSSGVTYDVPTYAKNVSQAYLNLKNGTNVTPTTPTMTAPAPNPSFTGLNPAGTPNTSIESSTQAVPDANTPNTAEIFGNIGKGLISGTVASGQDIAAAIGGSDMIDKFDKLNTADQNNISTFIQLRNKAAQEKDKDKVDHYQTLLKNYQTSNGESAVTVFPALNKSTEQILGDFASLALETIGGSEAAQGIGEATGLATKTGVETAAKPFLARAGQAAVNGGAYGAAAGVSGAMQNNESLEGIAKSGGVGAILGGITGIATEGVSTGLKGAFGAGKSAEEILATVPEDVKNLSAKEQKLWYADQATTARQIATDATTKAQAAAVQSNKEAVSEIQDISNQIANSSREETIALKPKVQQVMKDSSAHYIELTGEAADGSPALSKTITHSDLADKIDSKFEYNPEIASSLKQDLGLETPAPVVEGQSAPEPKTLTNQDILNKARDIMSDVSKSAKSGNRVYSADEYRAMQKYSFLMETLGDNGVDMTEANKFWKQYAPVRDRMVREVKPFDTEDVSKMPFESTLKKSAVSTGTANQMASKLDAQNFINELETRMKLPPGTIGSDTRDLVGQLEKAKLSKQTIKDITTESLAKIKADKAAQIKELGLQKYNSISKAESAARRNKIILGVIGTTLGLGVFGKGIIEKAAGAIGL